MFRQNVANAGAQVFFMTDAFTKDDAALPDAKKCLGPYNFGPCKNSR